jgi:hypothetical protein
MVGESVQDFVDNKTSPVLGTGLSSSDPRIRYSLSVHLQSLEIPFFVPTRLVTTLPSRHNLWRFKQ